MFSINNCQSRANGFSLVELLVAIVVISVAVVGVLLAFDYASSRSADAMLRRQALAIAQSLLKEVEQMPFTFCDPDDPAVSIATAPADCAVPEALGPEAGETRYSAVTPFDNVNDYNGFNMNGVLDITGTPIGGLQGYSASVAVANVVLNGVPALQITVTAVATGAPDTAVTMEGYRTQYAPTL